MPFNEKFSNDQIELEALIKLLVISKKYILLKTHMLIVIFIIVIYKRILTTYKGCFLTNAIHMYVHGYFLFNFELLFVTKVYCDCNFVVINATEGSLCFEVFITVPFALVFLSIY
jgi:hypothetical protein